MVLSVLVLLATHASNASAQLIDEDEKRIRWHQDESVSLFRRGNGPAPVTVATKDADQEERFVSLDESIRLALQYSEVIRVLAGVTAVSSGQTIYDTAIATTPIDQAKARFDPVFSANSTFRHSETPLSAPNLLDPLGALITDRNVGGTDLSSSLTDLNKAGGQAAFAVRDNWNRLGAGAPGIGAIDSTHNPTLELSYTQPLLAGFGRPANEAPIVIARLQQEQSYFQFKGGMQELVRGVASAYWSLVQARTELWAREKQVEQLRRIYEYREAEFRVGIRNITKADVSQAKLSYASFRASLFASQANVLQREAALRNLIGLPPEDGARIVPSTPPTRDQVEFRWDEIVTTAQAHRPDLIELNLILLADQRRLIQGKNAAQPSLDAVALHRWNGLSGQMLNGSTISTPLDNHTDWTMGVTFSVPLGLRLSRAQVRSQELLIARDRANIQQTLHQTEHALATTLRSIDQNYLQYEAYVEARQAGKEYLEVVLARRNFSTQSFQSFLNILQGITDWGNAVASEAQALTAYNTELANLELQTGTILETHGIRFVEEQFSSIGLHGRCFAEECYPRDLRPTDNQPRYEDLKKPAETAFDLENFPRRPATSIQLPQFPQAPDGTPPLVNPIPAEPTDGLNLQPDNPPK